MLDCKKSLFGAKKKRASSGLSDFKEIHVMITTRLCRRPCQQGCARATPGRRSLLDDGADVSQVAHQTLRRFADRPIGVCVPTECVSFCYPRQMRQAREQHKSARHCVAGQPRTMRRARPQHHQVLGSRRLIPVGGWMRERAGGGTSARGVCKCAAGTLGVPRS